MIILLAAVQLLIHLLGTLGDVAAGLMLVYTLVIRLRIIVLRLRRLQHRDENRAEPSPD